MQIRQGDVILKSIEAIPAPADPLPHAVLAEGEVTGHKHAIVEGKATLYQAAETLYLQVESPTALLNHEEHAPVQVPRGTWIVLIQREYTPEGWNHVAD